MKSIIKSYETGRDIYDYCERKISQVIEDLCKFEDLSIHKIESRVKRIESLGKKIEKKEKYTEISQITDIVGIRIIMLFEDEVDKVAELLKREFEIDLENSVDKRIKENPEAFGYASLHYVLKLKEPRKNLSEFELIKDIRFEVQIRSILQHAWAEIEHDLGYKSNSDIPKHIRRNFSRVSSFLEAADIEFVRIKEELEKYKSQVKEEISIVTNYSDIELNKLSVLEYLKTSSDIREILEEFSSELNFPVLLDDSFIILKPMQLFKIANINELSEQVKKYKNHMIDFGLRLKKLKDATPNITYSFILLTFYYVELYLEHDDEKLNQFLELSNISNPKRIKEVFLEFKKDKFLLEE